MRDYAEIGAAFVLVIAILLALTQLDLVPQRFAVTQDMSYPFIFVVGLVASISTCMAVTGGLLVAIAAKYAEANEGLTEARRLQPHIYFNAGRIVSYTAFGAAIGALGSTLTFSPIANGVLTLAASAIMIVLGLRMLKLLPTLTRLVPTMPQAFVGRIRALSDNTTKGGAFTLGAATFFLPCGFTQALQLYVLAKADAKIGALTMLAFAIGTLPALVSLSALSSLTTGVGRNYFLKLAGAAVVILGILNIQYGLVLTRLGDQPSVTAAMEAKPAASAQKQVVVMRIVEFDYIPNQFTVRQGVPVEWRIDASEAAGCGRILLAPGLGVRKLLSSNSSTIIAFTPTKSGEFSFNCGMGMMTPGSKFTVLPNPHG